MSWISGAFLKIIVRKHPWQVISAPITKRLGKSLPSSWFFHLKKKVSDQLITNISAATILSQFLLVVP